jgi:hypothetical protein
MVTTDEESTSFKAQTAREAGIKVILEDALRLLIKKNLAGKRILPSVHLSAISFILVFRQKSNIFQVHLDLHFLVSSCYILLTQYQ